MNRKEVYAAERIIVDESTGEVISAEKTSIGKYGRSTEPSYVKLYVDDIAKLQECTGATRNVLDQLLKIMDYENVVHINKFNKKRISQALDNMSDNYIRNCVSQLKQSNILLSTDVRGSYILNPMFFGKGKWKDINSLRLTVDYTEKGKHIRLERNVKI